jgi:hypothetical protein
MCIKILTTIIAPCVFCPIITIERCVYNDMFLWMHLCNVHFWNTMSIIKYKKYFQKAYLIPTIYWQMWNRGIISSNIKTKHNIDDDFKQ